MAKGANTKNGFPILTEKSRLDFGGKKPYTRDTKLEDGDLYGGGVKPLEGIVIKPKHKLSNEYAGKGTISKVDAKNHQIDYALHHNVRGIYTNGPLTPEEFNEIAKLIEANSTRGLFVGTEKFLKLQKPKQEKYERYEVSLSQKIKAKKDLKDLFKPLNRVKVKIFTDAINKIFPIPDQEAYKPGACVLTTLKGIAYLNEDKSEHKKYLPKDSEQDIIICGSIIYDYVRIRQGDLDSILLILEAGIYKSFKNDHKFLGFFDEITSVLRRIQYQDLDAAILDEFEHYDTTFKWLRANSLPSLEKVLEIVLDAIANKKIPTKHPFNQGILILNLVKKLGIRFITTRSNLEWALYGPQLKRIRNFMSKKTYLIYLTTVRDAIIKGYGSDGKYDVTEGNGGDNISMLYSTIEKLIEQKQKNSKRD